MKDLQNADNNNLRNGFIPLSRKLFEHPFWKQKRVFSYAEAWIDLIQKVRFEREPGSCMIQKECVPVKRGEFVISLRLLSESWGWSTKKLRNFFSLLCDESMVKIGNAKTSRTTIITICNYDKYNPTSDSFSKNRTHKRHAEDTRRTRKGHNTNKDNKEINRESNPLPQSEEFKKFIAWMQENTPYCANRKNIPEGITEQEFFKLREQYSKTQITEILLRIENRKDLRRRYSNLYLTVLNWLKKENEHGN